MLRGTYSVSYASLVCTPAQTWVLVYSTHVPSQACVKHSNWFYRVKLGSIMRMSGALF
jgi:hypothetical protein